MVGAVASVAAKKMVLEAAAAVPGVDDIVDHLQVEPAQIEQERPLLEQELDGERLVGKSVVYQRRMQERRPSPAMARPQGPSH